MGDPVGWTYLLAALALGYLLGATPFGVIVTGLARAGDPRKIGSGNIGATNVLRTGRKDLAALTLLGDALKGLAAVLIAGWWGGQEMAAAAGLGAFLGHLFPFWLRFRGGKGVATYIGVLLGCFWPAVPVFGAAWIVMAYLTRYSSAAALTASLATPVFLYALGRSQWADLFVLLTVLLWAKHWKNIGRLIAGTEGKIGFKG